MTEFSNEEYTDIVFAYGRADGSSRAAQRMYRESYPNRRVPHHSTFSNTFRRLRETGSLSFREPRVNARQLPLVLDERILQSFDVDPTTSIRKVARDLGVSAWKVWSVINADGRHPFHYTPTQAESSELGSPGVLDSPVRGAGRRASFNRAIEALHTPKGRRPSTEVRSPAASPATSEAEAGVTPARRPRRASTHSNTSQGKADAPRRSKKMPVVEEEDKETKK